MRKRNYLKKKFGKYKVLSGSKSSNQNKTEEYFNTNTIDNNEKIECPELTHFFIVTNIQKGIKNTQNYN